ncbi:MAG: hypothetical protein ACK55I_31195, partial [bacterium]
MPVHFQRRLAVPHRFLQRLHSHDPAALVECHQPLREPRHPPPDLHHRVVFVAVFDHQGQVPPHAIDDLPLARLRRRYA